MAKTMGTDANEIPPMQLLERVSISNLLVNSPTETMNLFSRIIEKNTILTQLAADTKKLDFFSNPKNSSLRMHRGLHKPFWSLQLSSSSKAMWNMMEI